MMTSTDSCKRPEMVEKRLSGVCLKIRETEVKIDTISKMDKEKLATKDVRNFVKKQSNMKVTSRGLKAN